MKRLASDDLRKDVWEALVSHDGNREDAARTLGKSLRTLNRYIHDLNLYDDMDAAGMVKNSGPPRGVERGTSLRAVIVVDHIKEHDGQVDYGQLAVDMYGEDNPKSRSRVYATLNDLKLRGDIANDGVRWFILKDGE